MIQSGYYWVRLNEHRDWEIALWDSDYNYWSFPGFTSAIRQVFEIDERRIEREPSVEEKNAANGFKPSTEEELIMAFEAAKNQKACEERFLENRNQPK